MKTTRSRVGGVSLTVGVIAVTCMWSTVRASSQRPLEPMRELRGLPPIRVDVDGMPNPLEGTDISEKTLIGDAKETLRALGVPLAKDADLDEAPRLHITVLAPRVEGSYSFTILVRLEERCSVARNPGLSIPWCVTWSSYPTIGFMGVAQAAEIKDRVLQSLVHFGMAYTADNKW